MEMGHAIYVEAKTTGPVSAHKIRIQAKEKAGTLKVEEK